MIDFHSHILPGIDDGCKQPAESEKLLRDAWKQGVTDIVATPHFYADQNKPERFLARREEALSRIRFLEGEMPRIHLGAEVTYFPGMYNSGALESLCMAQTRLILVEMPFTRWTDQIVEDVCELSRRRGLIPLLAHVERYQGTGQMRTYGDYLQTGGVLFQINAQSITKDRWAMQAFKTNPTAVLGSDCHNLTTRPMLMESAAERIRKKLGDERLSVLDRVCGAILSNGL